MYQIMDVLKYSVKLSIPSRTDEIMFICIPPAFTIVRTIFLGFPETKLFDHLLDQLNLQLQSM